MKAAAQLVNDVPPSEFDLDADPNLQELEMLNEHLVKKTYAARETLIKEDAAADSLYFLVGGSVDVCAARFGDETAARLASVDAGNIVGELALLSDPRRTADVIAVQR